MLKKTVIFLLIFVILCVITSCGKSSSEVDGNNTVSDTATPNAVTTDKKSNSEIVASTTNGSIAPSATEISASKSTISVFVEDLIENQYDDNTVESLTVMENHNTPEDDYKVYAIIAWGKESSPADSKAKLESYSNSISSIVNATLENVTELSLVWRVPALGGHGTIKYKKMDGFLSLYDIAFDKTFGEPTPDPDPALGTDGTADGATDQPPVE